MRYLFYIAVILVFAGCRQAPNEADRAGKNSHPSHQYHFVTIDTAQMSYFETDYLPVYSDIYYGNGTKRFPITATISIRNTSMHDSAWVLSARYYDSSGKPLRTFIDSTLLLSPLESVELVVEENEKEGGAGANFLIDWTARRFSNQLLIQSVMISTYGQQGVSFLSEAKVISRTVRN